MLILVIGLLDVNLVFGRKRKHLKGVHSEHYLVFLPVVWVECLDRCRLGRLPLAGFLRVFLEDVLGRSPRLRPVLRGRE